MSTTSAYILINVKASYIHAVLENLREMPAVKRVDIVTGLYDVIASIEADTIDEMTQLVVRRVQEIQGVKRTMTCIVVKPIQHTG